MKAEIISYLKRVISELDSCKGNYGEVFCNRKIEFFHKFQNRKCFGVSLGSEFFHEMLNFALGAKYKSPCSGGEIDIYERNLIDFIRDLA
jgi:hypothetical protein